MCVAFCGAVQEELPAIWVCVRASERPILSRRVSSVRAVQEELPAIFVVCHFVSSPLLLFGFA